MSIILTKHIYDCQCHPFCNEKSYFKTEIDNVGNTLLYQAMHVKPFEESKETIIGLFNSIEIESLIKVLTDK